MQVTWQRTAPRKRRSRETTESTSEENVGAGEETAVDADAALQVMKNAAVDEDSTLTAEKCAVDTVQKKNSEAGQ